MNHKKERSDKGTPTTGKTAFIAKQRGGMGSSASAQNAQDTNGQPSPGHSPVGIFDRLGDKPDPRDRKRTELFRLVQSGEATVEQLREVDANQPGPYGRRLLHAAAEADRADLVGHLIGDMGASVDPQDADGWSPAHFAASADAANALLELLKRCPKLSKLRNLQQQTPLMTAAIFGSQRAAKVLLSSRDPGVNDVDADGDSAAILSARCGQTEVLRLLVSHGGTKLKLKNKEGLCALDYAKERNDAKMLELLKSKR